MIVGADKRVSSAFLATLREEPSSVDLSAAFQRQERERTAILTVSGLAHAIARAEEHMREQQRARSSQPDIFAALAATDDCVGPALYQPYIPTPIPPRPVAAIAVEDTVVMPRIPSLPPPPPVAPAPILVLDRQAFYHPAGPIRPFAAPRSRRSALGWAALALAPFIALVALASVLIASRWHPKVGAALPSKMETPPSVVVAPEPPPPSLDVPKSATPEEPTIIVVDVNSLKPAKSKKR
ncbi:MAG: hypothetical protein KIT84_39280 [Labilithrix sp.]|nr:hypothetical protein [Labilithrix sp.]MCW5817105.1 hypothetical protein [Labilithrix sp.]